MIIPYYSSLRDSARELRKRQTPAETRFWKEARNRKILGYKFLRQKSICEYIADFYCHELLLVIEIDGEIHARQKEYDHLRSRDLESFGITVVRYTNNQILFEMPRVLNHLKKVITLLERHPSCASERGRG